MDLDGWPFGFAGFPARQKERNMNVVPPSRPHTVAFDIHSRYELEHCLNLSPGKALNPNGSGSTQNLAPKHPQSTLGPK